MWNKSTPKRSNRISALRVYVQRARVDHRRLINQLNRRRVCSQHCRLDMLCPFDSDIENMWVHFKKELQDRISQYVPEQNKKLGYRRVTARCVVSVEILPTLQKLLVPQVVNKSEVMKLKRYSKTMCTKHVHSTTTRSCRFHCPIGVIVVVVVAWRALFFRA